MTKFFRTLILIAFAQSAAFPAFAETASTLSSSATSVSPAIAQARKLARTGKYLEARNAYRQALKDPGITKEQASKIRGAIESLNMKILFSPEKMSGSTFHEVKPGDSLYVIAKKYGTTIELIKRSNHLTSDIIRPGQKLKVVTAPFTVHVDKSRNMLTLLLDGKPFKHYRVSTGLDGGTPVGDFKVTDKLENPTWYKTGAVVPPGSPENSLGTRWIGINTPGYGIHGPIEPETIGQAVTSGCVRMLNKEVEELYALLVPGARVTIAD